MIKRDKPSEFFLGAILRAWDTATEKGDEPITPSTLWDYVVMECLRTWHTSTAQNKKREVLRPCLYRINDIAQCIEQGLVPGLELAYDERGRWYVREVAK